MLRNDRPKWCKIPTDAGKGHRRFGFGRRRGGKGQGLVIVEAMKMENEVRSPSAGTVKEIKVKAGDTVEGGAVRVIVK